MGGARRARRRRRSSRDRWTRAVGALLDLDAVEPAELPAGLDATLRPYQVDGFRWLSLLWDCGLGGVLADDMGLGKTLQMLAMVLRAHERGELDDPVLVVAPTSVLSTWAERGGPVRPVAAHRGRRPHPEQGAGAALADTIAGAQVVITSYAVLRIDEVAFRSRAVGRGGARRGAVREEPPGQDLPGGAAARRARAKFAITGTPLENSLMDLWSLLSIVAPGLYPRPGAVHGAVGQADRERRRRRAARPRCAAASGR